MHEPLTEPALLDKIAEVVEAAGGGAAEKLASAVTPLRCCHPERNPADEQIDCGCHGRPSFTSPDSNASLLVPGKDVRVGLGAALYVAGLARAGGLYRADRGRRPRMPA
jgi:hypothetical protein